MEFEDFCHDKNFTLEELEGMENGIVIISNEKEGLYIKCIEGIIKVLEIQGENSKRMNISDFLRGNKIDTNVNFE